MKASELHRQTLPESWQAIVEDLNNPVQQQIVADDREQTNVLVLAGPGSGKTRVLVHRIAYLIRVRRENPRGILALAYNRHAAVEIREQIDAVQGFRQDRIGERIGVLFRDVLGQSNVRRKTWPGLASTFGNELLKSMGFGELGN